MWHPIRRTVQIFAAMLLLSPLAGLGLFLGTYSASFLVQTVHLADPFTALQVGVIPLAIAALPIVAANLLLGRVFCGWVCPLGLVLELVDHLRRSLRLKERPVPEWARWILAGTLLVGSIAAGQPLFEWLSPQANLYRFLLFGLAWEAVVIPAVALADLLLARRVWCRTLCPAGTTYGLLARAGTLRVRLDMEACDRCGTCLNVCPQGRATLLDAVSRRGEPMADPALCLSCGECIDACPHRGLRFAWDSRPDPGRRKALAVLGSAVVTMAFGRKVLADRPRAVLRPPGALPEEEFLATCVRCGSCSMVCPRKAILLENGRPYIHPRTESCDLCRKCPEVCPSGALTLKPDEPVRMGRAEINKEQCLAWGHETVCRSCYANCPLQEKALLLDRSHPEIWRPVVDPEQCAGCGMCEHICPQEPPAIAVRWSDPGSSEP